MGQFSFVHFLGFCTFCRFWAFLGIFCIFWVSGGVGGVLGVLLGYKITRGIKLVVRGSMIGFWKVWGGFEGVWRCFGEYTRAHKFQSTEQGTLEKLLA